MNKMYKIITWAMIFNIFILWGIIVVFFVDYMNNFLGYILAIICIAIEVYSHVVAINYIEEKYNLK